MNKKGLAVITLSTIMSLSIFVGCSSEKTPTSATSTPTATTASTSALKDGTYKGEAQDFDARGWKPFAEVTVKSGKITSVKYDYINKEGKFKSEDKAYNDSMMEKAKTKPEIYTKDLAKQLVDKQDPAKVDTITGATSSSQYFKEITDKLVNESAKSGKTDLVKVPLHEKDKAKN